MTRLLTWLRCLVLNHQRIRTLEGHPVPYCWRCGRHVQ